MIMTDKWLKFFGVSKKQKWITKKQGFQITKKEDVLELAKIIDEFEKDHKKESRYKFWFLVKEKYPEEFNELVKFPDPTFYMNAEKLLSIEIYVKYKELE